MAHDDDTNYYNLKQVKMRTIYKLQTNKYPEHNKALDWFDLNCYFVEETLHFNVQNIIKW